MAKLNFKDLLDHQIDFQLKKVVFEDVDNTSHNSSYKIITRDYADYIGQDENYLVFEAKRSLSFDPSGLFVIEVTAKMRRKIKEEYVDRIKEYNVNEELSKDIDDIFANTFDRISLIISELSFNSGFAPVITPPIFQHE